MTHIPESVAGTLRGAIRQLTKSSDQKLLEKHGVVFADTNLLTKEGRAVILQWIFDTNAEAKAYVLSQVKALEEAAEKESKKNKS